MHARSRFLSTALTAFAILGILGGPAALPATASVPRVIIGEDFGHEL